MTGWDGEPPSSPSDEREATNALPQTDYLRSLIEAAVAGDSVVVDERMICELNRLAMQGIVDSAGRFRDGPARILGSGHAPPHHIEIPKLFAEMLEEIHRGSLRGVELAAFALWRINWIHPFEDGNGRTARAAAYFIVCEQMRSVLPGRVALPERIRREKLKYYRCLEEADNAWARGKLDVSHMTGFLRRLLREQARGDP